MSRQERRRLERQQAKKSSYRHITAVTNTNQLIQVLVVGPCEDGIKYLGVAGGQEFNIKVTPEDYNRGEISVIFTKEQMKDYQKYLPLIHDIITVMKKANFTGSFTMSNEQLEIEKKDPKKEFLFHKELVV